VFGQVSLCAALQDGYKTGQLEELNQTSIGTRWSNLQTYKLSKILCGITGSPAIKFQQPLIS